MHSLRNITSILLSTSNLAHQYDRFPSRASSGLTWHAALREAEGVILDEPGEQHSEMGARYVTKVSRSDAGGDCRRASE